MQYETWAEARRNGVAPPQTKEGRLALKGLAVFGAGFVATIGLVAAEAPDSITQPVGWGTVAVGTASWIQMFRAEAATIRLLNEISQGER